MFIVFYTVKIVYMTCSTSYCLRDTLIFMDVWNVCRYVLFTHCKPLFIYLFVCAEQQCLMSITVWEEEWNINWASVSGSSTGHKTQMSSDFSCLTKLLFPLTQGNN